MLTDQARPAPPSQAQAKLLASLLSVCSFGSNRITETLFLDKCELTWLYPANGMLRVMKAGRNSEEAPSKVWRKFNLWFCFLGFSGGFLPLRFTGNAADHLLVHGFMFTSQPCGGSGRSGGAVTVQSIVFKHWACFSLYPQVNTTIRLRDTGIFVSDQPRSKLILLAANFFSSHMITHYYYSILQPFHNI